MTLDQRQQVFRRRFSGDDVRATNVDGWAEERVELRNDKVAERATPDRRPKCWRLRRNLHTAKLRRHE